jgi:NAD(P)-dependent dehydrogenase (short-subunit alcohol dehydrogenase family)
MLIKDKVVLVTGGASGIGAALCRRFQQEGARGVGVADLDADGARAVAESVNGLALTCDVAREDDIRRAVAEVTARFGPIDLLCSNAGIALGDGPDGLATSLSNDRWQRIWEINVMAHIYGARAVLPSMIARGGGYLLHTVSAAGLLNQIGDAAYSTTKHAAIGFAESLAITHGDQGIRVSVLCPQGVDTPMVAAGAGAGKSLLTQEGLIAPESVAHAVVEGLQAERFLILPHPQVADYMLRKAGDYDRWLGGMRKLRRKFT